MTVDEEFRLASIEIKNMALDAIASVNRLADEILEEFQFEHDLFMDGMDFLDQCRDREIYIYQCLLPYENIEDWWAALPDSELKYWCDTYEVYQYGPNGGLELDEQDFALYVMEFLRDRLGRNLIHP